VVEYLWQQAAVVARSVAFPPGVRLSSAFFNTEEEMDRIAAVVARFADLP
jgi:selenocysteine lyase/cysteine desulfurase